MIGLRRPSREDIDAQLGVPSRPFSHPEVGATADPASLRALSADYDVDRYVYPLGRGRDLYELAGAAVLAWRHFEIPWLELHGAGDAPASAGRVVATLTRAFGLWFLNPCRVVYASGSSGAADEVAFAYGTLRGHVECGEERFTVRFDPITGEVSYEILAFSRPAVLLSRLGYPWARRLQRRFAAASAEALRCACPVLAREPGAAAG